ncbi:tail fiber domain-containing protein, partial [bacterium]|nr:tail fiber domain-containing protein [bacterium]
FDRAHNSIKNITESADVESLTSGGSCCPILTPTGTRRVEYNENISSDIRLKNVGKPFNRGLNFLSKLRIYNFIFKNDNMKTPQVGVIAQDLKQIYPDAVSKDDKGYYQIRKEDMFFTAVNSAKELYVKLTQLADRIENDILRIAVLKKENAQLKSKLIELSKELDKLEK